MAEGARHCGAACREVRESPSVLRPRYYAEDRNDIAASVAWIHPHCSRLRGRVRISGPTLSLVDGNRPADHRGALVRPTVFWPDQTSGCCGWRRGRAMTPSAGRGVRHARVRCAIYTRKSSEEGLEQEFNSLQAQREACEAFINSQRHGGWVCLPAAFVDGGFSGARMDRP